MSQLINKLTGGGPVVGAVQSVTPDAGDVVTPDILGNINIDGTNLITTTGTAATNTVDIAVTGGTDGQVIVGSTAGLPAFATLTSVGGTIVFTPGANTLNLEAPEVGTLSSLVSDSGTATAALGSIDVLGGIGIETSAAGDTLNVAVNDSLQITTGFSTWGGAGAYFDDTTLGDFTLLRPGTGYINTVPVSWAAPQTVSGMTAGNTYFIYIDNTGTIGKTATFTDALYRDNIVLFECLRDSTLVNNQISVKENHPYTMSVETSLYAHKVIGPVIENNNNGANITINGTQKIQINGADVLSDHGLYTTISDSGGVGVTWRKMYTNAGGKWATDNVSDTFTGRFNSAGTPTALGGAKFGVYRLYVSKESLNAATPSYFAVLHTAEFNNLVGANTAIAAGLIAPATNELYNLELAQLGYIVYSQASNSIVNVIIEKATLRQTVSTAGTNTASLITTVVTNFDGILSAADTNVQAALETIDEFGKNLTDHAIVIGNGNGLPLGVIAVGATGQTVMGATGADPAWTGSPSFSGTATAGTGLTATTGDITASSGNLKLPTTSSTVGQLQINASRVLHTYGTSNIFVGTTAGNFTTSGAGSNASLGINTLKLISTGNSNTFIGSSAGPAVTTGSANTGLGQACLLGFSTGSSNTSIGNSSGQNLLTGSNNIFLGNTAGIGYTGAESSNISIGNGGTAGESNKMRLGTDGTGAGQVDTAVIAGTNVSISTAATAGTVNIATGAGAKVVTLGSTNGASSLALKMGTADFSIASATGTVMSILDTGEVTKPLQPAFSAYLAGDDVNVTGNGTAYTVGTNVAFTEIFDQNADFNTNGTFTAPVTGRYQFNIQLLCKGCTIAAGFNLNLVTTNRTYLTPIVRTASADNQSIGTSILADMDATETATITITVTGEAADTVDLDGSNLSCRFSGFLVC